MPSPAPQKFRVGIIQMAVGPAPDDNVRKALAKVEEAQRGGAQVVCLPELYRSPYFCQREDAAFFDLAESIPGPSTEAFSALAKRLGVAIIVPLFERRGPGIYHNSAAILDADGTMAGLYRKMHIPDDPSYYEKFYFTPVWKDLDTDLLGSVVSRRRAAGGSPGSQHSVLSYRNWLAPP